MNQFVTIVLETGEFGEIVVHRYVINCDFNVVISVTYEFSIMCYIQYMYNVEQIY